MASLGLTLYSLGQRREAGERPVRAPRPPGALAWLHVPGGAQAPPMLELARRLIDEDGLVVLLTCADPLTGLPGGALAEPPPLDTSAEARAFLDHWRPEIIVFSDGEVRPALVHEAASRKLPMLMVEAREPQLLRGRDGWYPGLLRGTLGALSHVAAVDEVAARAFRKAGALPSLVSVVGRMEEPSAALPCLEAERGSLAVTFASRPVWFAAALPEAEETAVLAAHRAALGLAHRLLLILLPERAERAEALAQGLEQDGWTVALRSADQDPSPETEVYVVDSPAELGLWYRLAPITFLGGSLAGGGALRSPLEPAALGSAILHGPRTGAFAPLLGRLGAARATRAVGTAGDLADALADLLAPDRAARLAHAAWAVATEGAEATEAVHARLRSLMDG